MVAISGNTLLKSKSTDSLATMCAPYLSLLSSTFRYLPKEFPISFLFQNILGSVWNIPTMLILPKAGDSVHSTYLAYRHLCRHTQQYKKGNIWSFNAGEIMVKYSEQVLGTRDILESMVSIDRLILCEKNS
jgi:hypothetical protein